MAVKQKPNNALVRHDPSRTYSLRRRFITEIDRRFRAISRDLYDLIARENAFGLTTNAGPPVINTRFAFHSTPEKVEAFRRWLKKILAKHLAGDTNKKIDEWWYKYCQEGYLKGAARAFSDTKRAAAKYDQDELRDFYSGTKEEFLRSSFGRPVAVQKVKLLAGRIYTDLKGITDTMSAKLTRTLTDGLVQGKNPKVIVRDIQQNVEGIDRTRARTIAQTEIVRCHAEGQLDAFVAMGVDKVGVAAEWKTADDDRVCEECDALDDVVMSVDEARGLLPRHPNCRCAWIPANVGEDDAEQVRDKGGVEDAIDESIEAEGGKNPREDTTWPGADAEIDDERPDELSVLNAGPVDEARDDHGRWVAAERVTEKYTTQKGEKRTREVWKLPGGKALPSHLAGKAIPPAWRNVQIAMNPKHHILAKGIDEKGRPVKTQADWFVKQQSEAKFARVREGIKKVDAIAKQNAGNLNSKDKTTAENAVVFRLIQHTGIRPGSDRDTKAAKQAYGATTLLGKHVVVDAQGKVSLHYTGKKGVDLNIPIHDKAIATDLLGRKWSAGSNGRIFDTTAAKLLAYSHSLDGGGFKTKDFRTIRGTMEAMNLVKNMAIPRSEAERKQRILEVAVRVSKVLGNTPAIALQSYIAPQVFSKWRSKA